MIPNSQYFNNNGKATAESTYYLRQILPDDVALTPAQHDGASLVSYGGNLMLMFGWNANNTQSAQIFSSSDLGRTYNALADAPFSSAEQNADIRADGKVWVWPTTAGKIYKYDGTWNLVSNNYPAVFSPINIMFNDKLIMLGGQLAIGGSPINNTDVYRYNDNTDTWDVIGSTPSDFWSCTGCAWVDGAYIYATGGAKVNAFSGTYEFLNDKIIRSSDGGVTWSVFATLPVGMRAMWQEALVYDDHVWFINGYSNGANQTGLWKSMDNGANWDLFTNSISGRHATSMCVHDDSLYIGWGNFHNDLWRVEKIVYPAQGFATNHVQTWWEKNWPVDRPSNNLLTAVNTLFTTLSTDISLDPLKTQLQCLDFFGIGAGVENENQWLVPLVNKNTSYLNSTIKNNSPTWATTGISSVAAGTGTYSINWNPSSYGDQYTLNSASGGVYVLSNQTHEVYDYGNGPFYMVPKSADNGGRFYGAINSPDFAVEGVASGKGYRGMSRRSSTSVKVYIDSTLNSITKASSTMGSANFTICGSLGYGSPRTFGFCFTGNGDVDHLKMITAMQTFFTTRGISY